MSTNGKQQEGGEPISTSVEVLEREQSTQRILSAASAVINDLQTRPESRNVTFKAASHLSEGLYAKINIRKFHLASDEPETLGGTDRAPNPVELILGAFGACQEIVISAYAAVLAIKVDSVSVEANGTLDLAGFFNVANVRPGYHTIEYTTTIQTRETDEAKLNQLVYFAQNRCPVLDILQNPVNVKGNFKFSR